MSFKVNRQELRKIYFNNNIVSKVIFKDGDESTVVWETQTFFEDLTWADLQDVCKRVAAGEINWPHYIKLGEVKILNLNTTLFDTNYLYVRLIGIDVEGPGTLTFQTLGGLRNDDWSYTRYLGGTPHYISFNNGESWDEYNTYDEAIHSGKWIGSDLRRYCQDIYNYCDAKDYIKTVKKYTYAADTDEARRNPALNEETVWVLSMYEMGFADSDSDRDYVAIHECSYIEETGEYSQPYPYCDTEEYRKSIHYVPYINKYGNTQYHEYWTGTEGMWTRSVANTYHNDFGSQVLDANSGVWAFYPSFRHGIWLASDDETGSKHSFNPCFVIG